MSENDNALTALSDSLAEIVAATAPSVVRVDDGSRLTATGMIWSSDGFVLTTSHGVERDEEVVVELASGQRLAAEIMGRDDESDLALLHVEGEGLQPITPAEESEARVGSLVLALGRPGRAGLQATWGIISARLETQSEGRDEYILNTDAVLYPGFSGGPLVNTRGQVVGLTNLALGRGQGVALGTSVLTHVVDMLRAHGQVPRGYLGISTQSVRLPESQRGLLGASQETGLLVVAIGSGSPAEAGGLFLGDILLALDNQPVSDADSLRRRLRALPAGQRVMMTLLRGGQRTEVSVMLGAQS